jgi:tRNA dimethylallyltransferase
VTRTPVAAIVGATAVGKTGVAVEVAERLGAEIVSIDSMQVYEGMDAGTAKPAPELLARVPHHLIDVVPAGHPLTVAEFQSRARAAIADVTARAGLALLVGGSGLYFRATVDDLEFPPRSEETRARLLQEEPNELYQRLRRLDPSAADKIEPSNRRRIVRALEVIELTGTPFSSANAWARHESIYDLAVAGLRLDRERLRARIAARVDSMLLAGLVKEARALEARGLSASARQALGYRQVLEASPGVSPEALREEIVTATNRFARRQQSWFGSDPRVVWFEASEPDLAEVLVGHFRAALKLP